MIKRGDISLSKLMLLEDDSSLIDGLQYMLKKNHYEFDIAWTVSEAKKYLENNEYDLLLLDVTLPDGTGFSLCEWVRRKGNKVPIIFLTASDEEINIIRGLDCGGDDYITKPFKMGELFSRIRALLRRAGHVEEQQESELQCGDITINLLKSQVFLQNKLLELTLGEYKLLCFLVRNAGHVVSRQSILDALWDQHGNFVDDNTISVYIRRLREKIEADPSHPTHLLTIRGFGYQWKEVSI